MTAKYIRLANILREQIKSNIYSEGNRLPTEEMLCTRYGVSRQTVREALKILKSEGLIETRQGSGTVVSVKSEKNASNKIAVLVSSDSEYTYPGLISDLKSVFKRNGYITKVMITGDSMQKERELLHKIIDGKYAGLIAEPIKNAYAGANQELYEKILNKGTQIVFVGGEYLNFPYYHVVKSDDVYGGYLAGRLLFKQNHTNIACLLNRDSMAGLDRYQGILMAQNDCGAVFSDDMCTWFSTDDVKRLRQKQDYGFINDFINKNIHVSSAVICMNDEIAYWMIKELTRNGYDIPGDMSIVSFDNSFLSSLDKMQITTLSHKAHEPGKTAAQILVKLMSGQPESSQKLSWHIVNRESDAPFEGKK